MIRAVLCFTAGQCALAAVVRWAFLPFLASVDIDAFGVLAVAWAGVSIVLGVLLAVSRRHLFVCVMCQQSYRLVKGPGA